MARIRSLKPDFPQSESMGRVSRDARLLFIELWTISDDSGRARASSRMLASLLFPYDDDAPSLIDGWMEELEREECIQRYKAEGQSYLQITNWLSHQKIDKPTPSKIPPFANPREDSPRPRESSSGDRIGRDRRGEDIIPAESPSATPVLEAPPSSPSSRKAKSEEITPEEKELRSALRESFDSQNLGKDGKPRYANHPREGKAIADLAKVVRDLDPFTPMDYAQRLLETYRRLTQAPKGALAGKPFLPTMLSTSWILNTVVEEIRRGEQQVNGMDELLAMVTDGPAQRRLA